MNIVLESLDICISPIPSSELRNLTNDYVKKTSRHLHENNICLGAILSGGDLHTENVEYGIDLLIEISTHDAEDRALLADCLTRSLKSADGQFKTREPIHPDAKPGDYSPEEGYTWVAIRKLIRHLLIMRMDFKNEKSIRDVLPTLFKEGVYKIKPLLTYLTENPSAMDFRTSEVILHLSSSVVCVVRTSPARYGQRFSEADAAICERLTPVRSRVPLWFEDQIPQHDGWALALGDEIECLSPDQMTLWTRLFEVASLGNTTKPSKPFLKAARTLRDEISELNFTDMFNQIEAATHGVSPILVVDETAFYPIKDRSAYSPSSVSMLRGLIRIAALYPSPRNFLSLERIMERCFEKITLSGPRCEALGQEALDSMVSMEIQGKPERLQQALLKFKSNKNIKKRLTKAIHNAGGNV